VSEHRCGVVALLGRPNSGKSTLLNALVGEKVAITSHRAQTTRGRQLAVLTRPGYQILFRDTPGVHRGQARFNLAMTDAALAAAKDADLRLLLLDARAEWDTPEERLSELEPPLLLLRTKSDLGEATPLYHADRFAACLALSAQTGEGLESLVERIVPFLPEGPALYPDDYLTDAPLRFLAAEQIREVVFEQYEDEIPYGVAVEVEEYKEGEGEVRVRANLLVERDSQKGIVVGQGGRMLKAVGIEARRRLGERLGVEVHLNLWVKLDKNWSKRPRRARQLGYL
jgi:GTP-binding protein Era